MKILIIIVALLAFTTMAWGDSITLDSAETLSTPTAVKISDWEITSINVANKRMVVRYRWRTATDSVAKVTRDGWNTWTCRDIETRGENVDCLDVDDPWDCCTGAGTGTCDGMDDTCFSDVFGFEIRQVDVGTSIGAGLRTLIWNQMKQDILTGANDGDFD